VFIHLLYQDNYTNISY